MFSLDVESRACAREVMASSGANNFCLFVYDARGPVRGVKFLLNFGMSEEVRKDYSQRLWAYDPFLLALPNNSRRAEPRLLERRELESGGSNSQPYWQYIDSVGYREIVASVHPFTPEIFLVGGLMNQNRNAGGAEIHTERVLARLDTLVGKTAGDLISHSLGLALPAEALPEPAVSLTRREQDVVRALASGNSNKQIAALLTLSEYTVQNHLKRLFRRFSVTNRTALLSRLRAVGLLQDQA